MRVRAVEAGQSRFQGQLQNKNHGHGGWKHMRTSTYIHTHVCTRANSASARPHETCVNIQTLQKVVHDGWGPKTPSPCSSAAPDSPLTSGQPSGSEGLRAGVRRQLAASSVPSLPGKINAQCRETTNHHDVRATRALSLSKCCTIMYILYHTRCCMYLLLYLISIYQVGRSLHTALPYSPGRVQKLYGYFFN